MTGWVGSKQLSLVNLGRLYGLFSAHIPTTAANGTAELGQKQKEVPQKVSAQL